MFVVDTSCPKHLLRYLNIPRGAVELGGPHNKHCVKNAHSMVFVEQAKDCFLVDRFDQQLKPLYTTPSSAVDKSQQHQERESNLGTLRIESVAAG